MLMFACSWPVTIQASPLQHSSVDTWRLYCQAYAMLGCDGRQSAAATVAAATAAAAAEAIAG